MIEHLITRKEAARRTQCCTRTLDRAIQRRDIEYIRIGHRYFFTEAARVDWLRRNTYAPLPQEPRIKIGMPSNAERVARAERAMQHQSP
jgi:hypothetical protein